MSRIPFGYIERRHVHKITPHSVLYVKMKLGGETNQMVEGKRYNIIEWNCCECPVTIVEMILIEEKDA